MLWSCEEVAQPEQSDAKGAGMRKVTLAAAAFVVAVFGGSAYADDSSMSRWTGDSYHAFEAARTSSGAAVYPAEPKDPSPDNGMSRWNGDSYRVFETVRISPMTISVAEARAARATPSRDAPARTTTRGRTSVNAFRDDTGA
jgi:hypothetical protein